MTRTQRLRAILAYEFSGQRSYACCDIPTRERIDNLIPKLTKVFNADARLVQRVAALNPQAGEIGPGMLANLVHDARELSK